MFAYCNNNPVGFSDVLGCAPSTALYPVCIGGNGYRLVSGSSDGNEKSDELLQFVSNQYVSRINSTLFIDVEYLGTYTHTNDSTIDNIFALAGGASLLLLIPAVREFTIVSNIITIAGYASSAYGLLGLVPAENLAEKDYHQYKVTMSWTEKTSLTGYPHVFYLTEYHVEMLFLWDDTKHAYQTWYLLGSNWSEVRSNFE